MVSDDIHFIDRSKRGKICLLIAFGNFLFLGIRWISSSAASRRARVSSLGLCGLAQFRTGRRLRSDGITSARTGRLGSLQVCLHTSLLRWQRARLEAFDEPSLTSGRISSGHHQRRGQARVLSKIANGQRWRRQAFHQVSDYLCHFQ